MLLASGAEHPTSDDATGYAAAYGLFISAAVASFFGDPVRDTLTLGGNGGGVFDLDSRGAVTLTVSRQHAAGPPAAEVTDALAGRAPAAAVLAPLPACTRTALSHLADFFTAPVDQSPAGETRDPINDDRSPAHHGNTQLEPVAHARHLPATPEEEQRA